MKKHIPLFIICFSVLSFFSISCSTENVNSLDNSQNSDATDNEGYYISLTAELSESKSRAHWNIANDEKNSLEYVWDASVDEMKSFVKRGDELVSFTDRMLYSPTTVTPNSEIKTKTLLGITKGLDIPYQNDDVVWAVSPVSDTNIKITEDYASVEFTLPDAYVQTAISTTEHLKPYVFMTGSGMVNNNAASLNFKVLTAVYRFKITNSDTETFTLSEVGITGPFCNKVVVGVAGTPEYSISPENSDYTIKVTAKGGVETTETNGIKIESSKTAYMYAMVFPTSTSTIDDDVTLFIKGAYGNLPINYNVPRQLSRMRAAARASTFFLCFFSRLPFAERMAWASTLLRRSSQSRTSRPVRSRRSSAKARLFSALGPSEPSMFLGRPRTMSPTSLSRHSEAMRSARRPASHSSTVKASPQSTPPASEKARPVRLSP